MAEEKSVRIAIEVTAGLFPGNVIEQYTKRFIVTSDVYYAQGEYQGKQEEAELEIMKTYGFAQEYMRSLWNPGRVNYVRCDWIYF